jgi:hypothetical protein
MTPGGGGRVLVGVGAVGEAGSVRVWVVVGDAALFTWPVSGRVNRTAREPEDCAKARPIEAPATTAITARTIPRRLLMGGSFDLVVGSEKPVGWMPWDLLVVHTVVRIEGITEFDEIRLAKTDVQVRSQMVTMACRALTATIASCAVIAARTSGSPFAAPEFSSPVDVLDGARWPCSRRPHCRTTGLG